MTWRKAAAVLGVVIAGIAFGSNQDSSFAASALVVAVLAIDMIVQYRRGFRAFRTVMLDATAVYFLIAYLDLQPSLYGLPYLLYFIAGLLMLAGWRRWILLFSISGLYGALSIFGLPLTLELGTVQRFVVGVLVAFALIMAAVGLVWGVVEAFSEQVREQTRSNESLTEASVRRDRLISSLGHELRTPLTGVIGFGHELHRQWDTLNDATRREFALLVAQQGAEATEIAENLLVAARADTGLLAIRLDRVPASLLVEDSVRRVDWLRGVSTSIEVVNNAEVMVDRERVVKALKNLVLNAYHHGGPGVRVLVDGGIIEVRDNGPEIAESDAGIMFNAFAAARQHTRPSPIGVGLPVAKSLIELMGGTLNYHRDRNETVFEVSLPVFEEGEVTKPDATPRATSAESSTAP